MHTMGSVWLLKVPADFALRSGDSKERAVCSVAGVKAFVGKACLFCQE